MWYLVKGEKMFESGAAAGSRAVLLLAIFFFIGCVAHSVSTVVAEFEGLSPLVTGVEMPGRNPQP